MTAHSLMFGPADIARAVQEGRDAERDRILSLLKSVECVGCDLGAGCSFLDSKDYLILVIEESQA